MLLFSTKSILAQTTVTVGNTASTSTTEKVINRNYNYSAEEIIYLSTEIPTTGNLTKLALYKYSGSNVTAIDAVTIYLKNTSAATLTSAAIGTSDFAGYTQVYTGSFPNATTSGWAEVELNTAFSYTGNNLSVLIIKGNQAYLSSGYPTYQYTSTSSVNRTRYYQNDTAAWTAGTSMTVTGNRPNIRFTIASGNGCNSPTNLASSNITATAATLSWAAPSAGNTPESYQWEVRSAGTAGSGTDGLVANNLNATTTSANIIGLTGNTLYSYYVRTNCGSGTYSTWASGTFTTQCGAVAAPYSQNFDSATTPALPSCFTTENVNGDSSTWKTYGFTNNSAPNSVYVPSASGSNNDNLYTQGISLTAGSTYRLSFKYYIPYSFNYKTDFTVKYGMSPSAAGMQQTLLSLTDAVGISGNYAFTTYLGDFIPTQTGTYYIGFQAQDQGEIYVDDISLVLIPPCTTFTFPTTATATVSKTTICSQESLSFNLSTPMPTATGITYQWKSSPDGVTYLNEGLPAATPVRIMTANTNANYFKCDVLCNGTVVLTSAPIEINIQVSVLSTTEGTGCGNTPINLSATTQTGNTLKWYDAATGGTALSTGNIFTIDSLTQTTDYYVAATGTESNITTGAPDPATLGSLGSTNNGEAVIFSATSATKLHSVTIYPVDSGTNNKIILKNSAGATLQEYTFTITPAEANSTNSSVGSPKVVTLNWDIPTGTGYQLKWDNPGGATVNRVMRNLGGAANYYNRANENITITGNTASTSTSWYYFYNWQFINGCGESAIRVPVTATVKAEWTGDADSNWSNPANWCGNALPTAATNVTVNTSSHNPEIATGTAYANSLTLQPGTALTVKTGATLSVENTLTTTGATLTAQNNAALLQGSLATTNTNVGNITAIKNSNSLYRLDYTLWSAPVSGQNLHDFSQQTVTTRFYEYKYVEQYNQEYYTTVDPFETSFATAKSYLIRMPDTDSTPNYNNGTAPISFAGTFTGAPHNGTITVDASVNGRRYTAIGNPYPSPISIASFFTQNSGVLDPASAIYFWRKKNNASKPSYATITRAGYIANTAGGGAGNQLDFYGDPDNYANWLIAPDRDLL